MFDLCSIHKPADGIIELRIGYNLADNSILIADHYGRGILTVQLDKVADPGGLIAGLSKLLCEHATEQQADAKALREMSKEDYIAYCRAKAAKASVGGGPGPGL
jgi:hypothetical protein